MEHVTKLRDWFVAQRTFLFFQVCVWVCTTVKGTCSTDRGCLPLAPLCLWMAGKSGPSVFAQARAKRLTPPLPFSVLQASVLLTYEGSASTIEEAKLQVGGVGIGVCA